MQDLNRVAPAADRQKWAFKVEIAYFIGAQGRRRNDESQRATSSQDCQLDKRKQDIGVKTSLMGFIKDDDAVSHQVGVNEALS